MKTYYQTAGGSIVQFADRAEAVERLLQDNPHGMTIGEREAFGGHYPSTARDGHWSVVRFRGRVVGMIVEEGK